jgi:hypothetical protein
LTPLEQEEGDLYRAFKKSEVDSKGSTLLIDNDVLSGKCIKKPNSKYDRRRKMY